MVQTTVTPLALAALRSEETTSEALSESSPLRENEKGEMCERKRTGTRQILWSFLQEIKDDDIEVILGFSF